jgi:hypothetical protein
MLRTPNIINGEYRTTMTAEEQRRNDVLRQRLQTFLETEFDPDWREAGYEFYVHASDSVGARRIARDGVDVTISGKNGGGFFTSQSLCGAEYFGIRRAGEGNVRGVVVLVRRDDLRPFVNDPFHLTTRPVGDHPYIRETVFRSRAVQDLINGGLGDVLKLPDDFFNGGWE